MIRLPNFLKVIVFRRRSKRRLLAGAMLLAFFILDVTHNRVDIYSIAFLMFSLTFITYASNRIAKHSKLVQELLVRAKNAALKRINKDLKSTIVDKTAAKQQFVYKAKSATQLMEESKKNGPPPVDTDPPGLPQLKAAKLKKQVDQIIGR